MTRSWLRPAQIIVAVLLCILVIASRDGESPAITESGAAAGSIVSSTPGEVSSAIQPDEDHVGTPAGPADVFASLLSPMSRNHPANAAAPLQATANAAPRAEVARPVRLHIPSLGIDTAIQWVGVDSEGRMGLPTNYTDVAWYQHGPTPGTPGNAVIAGHFDSKTGPAVFYDLGDLKPGDEIITLTEDGQKHRFIVTEAEVYYTDNAPLERIFGPADTPSLNLITCDGVFDHARREYDQRLVVYSTLASGP